MPLAVSEKVARRNIGYVCFVHCNNALNGFLSFFWIKLYALRKMIYGFLLSTTLNEPFHRRCKNNTIPTARLQHSCTRSLDSPVGEKISNWLRSVIAAS